MTEKAQDQEGLEVARDFCRWYIGDPTWAYEVIRAYLNPELVAEELKKAKSR